MHALFYDFCYLRQCSIVPWCLYEYSGLRLPSSPEKEKKKMRHHKKNGMGNNFIETSSYIQ